MKVLRNSAAAVLLILLVISGARARQIDSGQIMQPGMPMGGPPQNHNPGARNPEDETQHEMIKKMEARRNEDRQKQLVKDTDRLLALATDLKTEVGKTDKNTLSIEVVKKAEAIEKLARSVKEKMRD